MSLVERSLMDLGDGKVVNLHKIVAFKTDYKDTHLTIYLEGGHEIDTRNQLGIKRFLDFCESKFFVDRRQPQQK